MATNPKPHSIQRNHRLKPNYMNHPTFNYNQSTNQSPSNFTWNGHRSFWPNILLIYINFNISWFFLFLFFFPSGNRRWSEEIGKPWRKILHPLINLHPIFLFAVVDRGMPLPLSNKWNLSRKKPLNVARECHSKRNKETEQENFRNDLELSDESAGAELLSLAAQLN